jgi:hypothetical protein
MNIWERVKTALDTLGLPLAANVYLSATPEALPDTYLVFQVISDPGRLYANDTEQLRSYRVQVSIYSRSGIAAIPDQVETAMINAGFTRLPGLELPYNLQTRHFGYAMDFNYLEERQHA